MKALSHIVMVLVVQLCSFSMVLGQGKFALSTTVAPMYRHFKSRNTIILPDNNGGTYTYIDKSEGSWRGSWFGLNGQYSFSPKWSATTGLWYNKSRLISGNTEARSHNFSIPLMINFQSSTRKLSPYFSVGSLWNLETTTHMYIDDIGPVVFKSGDKTFKISPTVGAGVIYNFSKHFTVIAQPTFSYVIPPVGFNSRTYQLLFHVQLMYRF
ncbi:outer membrane beta-barrel protein [Dyadobacter sp. CY356]|uniref:outer membrane beta-barrel protein n=1 Tax=Dyadobacter sp. CY356 TaxID=2906442 RepID=UPI001F287832|nr:outer membrane beta-barrel protein [Dyadobacter sp. CY356]MCF0056053.1 porin family protein [Dyadobacter sp. CY356]